MERVTENVVEVVDPDQDEERNPYIRCIIRDGTLSESGEWKLQIMIQFVGTHLTSKEMILTVFPKI